MTHLVVTLPLKIESTANKREHWAARARRAGQHRTHVLFMLRQFSIGRSKFAGVDKVEPCIVTMTRIAPRELDDDNLAGGFKSVRDGIADWLGVNDNDKRIEWKYAQERGAPKHYAARIEIQAAARHGDARTQAGASDSQPQGATE